MSRLMQERRRLVCAFLGCALAAMAPGALAQAKKPAASKEPLVFSINEGATTLITAEELFERYTRLAKSTERTLARPVRLEVYPDTARFRAELDRRRFDIVFGKTVNLLAGMIRDKQFQAVVKTKVPYVAGFITLKGSPIKKPEDMRGKVIMMPERVFTTKLGEATLRDLGFKEKDVTIRYTRFQEAVAVSVDPLHPVSGGGRGFGGIGRGRRRRRESDREAGLAGERKHGPARSETGAELVDHRVSRHKPSRGRALAQGTDQPEELGTGHAGAESHQRAGIRGRDQRRVPRIAQVHRRVGQGLRVKQAEIFLQVAPLPISSSLPEPMSPADAGADSEGHSGVFITPASGQGALVDDGLAVVRTGWHHDVLWAAS